MDIVCQQCDHEFEARVWTCGECPSCGLTYWWDEMYNEDYSDTYAFPQWDT